MKSKRHFRIALMLKFYFLLNIFENSKFFFTIEMNFKLKYNSYGISALIALSTFPFLHCWYHTKFL